MSLLWLMFATICVGSVHSILIPNTRCKTSNETNPFARNELCQFPFTYNNQTYYSCTFDYSGSLTNFTPWCSVKTDDEGNHVDEGTKTIGLCDDQINCPIPPRYCGDPKVIHKDVNDKDYDATIEQQPWMVSLGLFEPQLDWNHKCAGSLITNKHVLTTANCLVDLKNEDKIKRYLMRLGITNILLRQNYEGTHRNVAEVMIHPQYQKPAIYFDVGIAVADRIIEFGPTIRPICLPFQPIDDPDHFKDQFVNLAGWGIDDSSNNTAGSLHINNLKVPANGECQKIFGTEEIEKNGLPKFLLDTQMPNGLTKELTCLENQFGVEKACLRYSGSPIILDVNGKSNRRYFEQHFLLSSNIDCQLSTMVYIRISSRRVLTWIQNVTETSPSLMVVGGLDGFGDFQSSVEILSSTLKERCLVEIKDVIGVDVLKELNIGYHAGQLHGHTGQFTKGAAIVCGGSHREGISRACYEFNALNNSWFEIPSMYNSRHFVASTVDDQDNLWVIGGSQENCENANASEIYDYKPNGAGVWKQGVDLPSNIQDSSISDQCVVRINDTHVFMVGGLIQPYKLFDPFADESVKKAECSSGPTGEKKTEVENGVLGGVVSGFVNKGWIFDGKQWTETEPMAVIRDQPACSLVEMDNGEIGVLVTSGCDGWCNDVSETPPIHLTSEVYNLQTRKWIQRKALLPNQLNSGKLGHLDGLPTFVGGYNEDEGVPNIILYQYHWDRDEWIPHPTLNLTNDRTLSAVFQVPKDLFGIC